MMLEFIFCTLRLSVPQRRLKLADSLPQTIKLAVMMLVQSLHTLVGRAACTTHCRRSVEVHMANHCVLLQFENIVRSSSFRAACSACSFARIVSIVRCSALQVASSVCLMRSISLRRRCTLWFDAPSSDLSDSICKSMLGDITFLRDSTSLL